MRWGKESTDEMGSISFLCVAKDPADHQKLASSTRRLGTALAGGDGNSEGGAPVRGRIAEGIANYLEKLDKNKDGNITTAEVGAKGAQSRLFKRLDKNGDGTVSKAELDSL